MVDCRRSGGGAGSRGGGEIVPFLAGGALELLTLNLTGAWVLKRILFVGRLNVEVGGSTGVYDGVLNFGTSISCVGTLVVGEMGPYIE